jgi:uncharacterized membrane protein YeaQ/YmgE (transglycosylase-associated protein family)
MPKTIRVRDVARNEVYDCAPEEAVLRGPYDLFQPNGPVRLRPDGLVEWEEGHDKRNSRVAAAVLGDTHPGERVLMRIPPHVSEGEWWLCEIQAIDGVTTN